MAILPGLRQDPVLKEVVSWKLKGHKPPYRKMNRRSRGENSVERIHYTMGSSVMKLLVQAPNL